MPIDVTMPKLTDTMEEGRVVRWLKSVGDTVKVGDVLAEVETDKADMELEAAGAGVVAEIRVGEGATAAIGAVIAVLADNGASTNAAAAPVLAPVTPPTAAPAGGVRQRNEAVVAADGLRASPVARKRASEIGVDLTRVEGTGPAGRITKQDVEAVGGGEPLAGDGRPVAASGRVELSAMRRTIARRMAEAKREVPHFYVTSEIDMAEALRLREGLHATGMSETPVSVTHMIIKAAAMALQRHPRVNAAWDNDALRFSEAVNVGIATAVEDGLLVPVLKGCERLSLKEIAAAARHLNEKAKGGRFTAEEMTGATFTISNMGMLDVDEFSAVINPPQAAILAVGAIKERAVVKAGQLAIAPTMRVTLSCDHRVLNGVEGARFLGEVKLLLQNPVALVVTP